MLKRARTPGGTEQKLTFVLPAGEPAGPVSVVGNFNGWTPGLHLLRRRSNGTRSASVTVPTGTTVHFRFLADGGHWFDEPDADAITAEGSLVHVRPSAAGGGAPSSATDW